MMGCLYRISFPNGKAYIGVTMQPLGRRMMQHRRRYGEGGCPGVSAALRKYGAENVRVEALVVSDSREYLALIEARAVEVFGTLAPAGYNVIPGGGYAPGIYRMPEEQRARRRGRKASAETRAKMSAARRGKKRPPSYSEKLSARNRGNKHGRGRWLTSTGIVITRGGKWKASIVAEGKRHYLGVFPDEKSALSARSAAVARLQAGLLPVPFAPSSRNTSGCIGVSWSKREGKWRARHKARWLGQFDDMAAAAAAVAKAVAMPAGEI